LDQFLHDNVNNRTDEYCCSIENRSRFPLEVIKAVTEAVGADHTGIRLSPYNYFQDTRDSDPNGHWIYLCEKISALSAENRPCYVHMIEPRFDEVLDEKAKLESLSTCTGKDAEAETTGPKKIVGNTLDHFRGVLKKTDIKFLTAGNFNRDNAVPKLESEAADAIVFGRPFIANPDLPRRLKEGLPLNRHDRSTFYGADPPQKGYTDYPFYEEKKVNGTS
jgi:2,4-dienoyl-CoA reductase-like NADH-dependent reductase (Old Yellow Enzyme family)